MHCFNGGEVGGGFGDGGEGGGGGGGVRRKGEDVLVVIMAGWPTCSYYHSPFLFLFPALPFPSLAT